MDHPVNQDPLATQEMWVDRESVDATEQRELLEHLEHAVRLVLSVKQEVPVFVENEENQVQLEHPEVKDHPDHEDHQVNQVLTVRKDPRDQQDDQEILVQVVHQEPQDHQVSPDHRAHKVAEVHQETQV